MSSLINRRAVKQTALDLSQRLRNGTFKRVGKTFLDRIEAKTKNLIVTEIEQHPSKGKR